MKVVNVTVEYKENPIGLDVPAPRIFWMLEDERRGSCQVAYQIQVSEDADFTRFCWDTGKIDSSESTQIPYKGTPLRSRTKYFLRIRVWDQNQECSEWSNIGYWETALLDSEEWQADWITPDYDFRAPKTACPILRKDFSLEGKIKQARVYVTAKGLYELRINGEKAGEDFLTPGWTSYNKRTLYQIYDVTDLVKSGNNALGVTIGSGWYKGELGWRSRRNLYGGREALILELHIEFEDGTTSCICSDKTWKSTYQGPVLFAEIYHGETYDARKEESWDMAGFDDSHWFGVRKMGRVTKSILKAQECEAVHIKEVLKPKEILKTPKGEVVLDMGQNMTGWVQFKVKGKAGDRVVLRHAEMLDSEGNFYTDNLKGAKQQITYLLKGEGEEVFRPHFTFQGFRYVCIEEFPGIPKADMFEGLVLYSDLKKTGEFSCSDPWINQLQHNIVWGQKGNFVDIPTDCPQRCERLGWAGDIQIFAATAALNMQVPLFLTKWLRDLAAEQFESGGVPWVIPDIYDDTYAYDLVGYEGQSEQVAAAWGDAATICPWQIYLAYGDIRLLEEQYDSMKAYVEYIYRQGENPYTWDTGHQLGDWVALDAPYGSFIGATDVDYVATAYYACSAEILAKSARLLGKEKDAEYYEKLHNNIRQTFIKTYINGEKELTVKTQTAIILALQFELVPRDIGEKLAGELADWLKKTNYDLITGFVGTPYICHVLEQYGYAETAYKLLFKKEYPSWLYQVTKGATTVWEHLDGLKPDGTLWNPRMNSFNHYAYGSVGEWFYKGIAGIKQDEECPGYKHFSVSPCVTAKLQHAKAEITSLYGTIVSEWEKNDGKICYKVEVPVNTTATITLPDWEHNQVFESGKDISECVGILERKRVNGEIMLEIGSGKYVFEVVTQ